MNGDRDLIPLLKLAAFAIADAEVIADARLTAEQRAEVRRRLADGSGHTVLVVSRGRTRDANGRLGPEYVHIEFALASPGTTFGESAVLRFSAPLAAALKAPEQITLLDLTRAN